MKKTMSLALLASAVLAFGFMGCNEKKAEAPVAEEAAATAEAPAAEEAAADGVEGEDKGFEEFDIGAEQTAGFLNVAGVYFQACDLELNGQPVGTSQDGFHIEADISANENNLGYGKGDFVPYLTVDYEIAAEDGTIPEGGSGTFMLMNASDGPHYGANIPNIPQGKYKVTFKIHSPESNGFVLHTDKLTGVEGRFSDYWTTDTLDVSWDWEWKGPQWSF